MLGQVRDLVDEVRATCLWYLREDFTPETAEEALKVLDAIERHGDLGAYRRARELKTWLSRPSSARSAAS